MLFSLLNTDVSKYYTEEKKLHNFDQNGANHSWNLSFNIDTWKTLKWSNLKKLKVKSKTIIALWRYIILRIF